jgi:predicted helicase
MSRIVEINNRSRYADNIWATETMGNPKYPLELFLRVITVSLETMRVVGKLPVLILAPNAA